MKPIAWQIHIVGFRRGIQAVEQPEYPRCLLGINPASVTLREEPFKPFVPETSDHRLRVMCDITVIVMSDMAMSRGGYPRRLRSRPRLVPYGSREQGLFLMPGDSVPGGAGSPSRS